MSPIISRLSSLGGGGTGGFTFGKRKVPGGSGGGAFDVQFELILANTSSNNIIKYNSITDTFSSVTIGSSGQIYHLHNTSSGLVAIANGDGNNCTVYRSTNNGSSWSSIGSVGFSAINQSRYSSKSGETIVVNQGSSYDPPVRRSTNGGSSWSGNITLPGFSGYGALGSASRSNGNWYYTGRHQGGYDVGAMWRSTDDGANWTRVATFSNDQTNGKVTYMSNVSRYLAANYPYSTYSYQKPVYSSNGTSWTNPGNGNDTSNRIDTDLDASSTSCIGTRSNTSIFRSTDGLNWSSIDLSYLSGLNTHRSVTYDSTLDAYFVLGSSYFLISLDDGITWQKKSTIISGDYSSVAPLILPS